LLPEFGLLNTDIDNVSNISDLIGELSHEYTITYDSDNYPLTIKKYAVYNGVQSLISEANIQYN
jgi:hypothetical protein